MSLDTLEDLKKAADHLEGLTVEELHRKLYELTKFEYWVQRAKFKIEKRLQNENNYFRREF